MAVTEHKIALEILTEVEHAQLPKRLEPHRVHIEKFARSQKWTQHPNIAGFGIGEKLKLGELTDRLALRIYVRKKEAKVSEASLIPKFLVVPKLGKFHTDVVEVGDIKLHSSPTARIRPAPPGCSIGIGLVVGTLGAIVKRKRNEGLFLLSNCHVIAQDGLAKLNTDIYQPAPVDQKKSPDNLVAKLRAHVPLKFTDSGFPNKVDAAIASIVNNHEVTTKVMGIGAPNGTMKARRFMSISKSGRTTTVTHAKVLDLHFRTAFQYQQDKYGNIGRVGFRDQIMSTHYTDEGDSGSLVFGADRKVIGLHFAGSDKVSVCNPIDEVFKALQIELA